MLIPGVKALKPTSTWKSEIAVMVIPLSHVALDFDLPSGVRRVTVKGLQDLFDGDTIGSLSYLGATGKYDE